MQLKSRVYAVILVILLTGANLAMFKTLDLLDNGKPPLQIPVPKEVNWKIRLNLKTFAKKELYTILFQQEDKPFMDKMSRIIRERMENSVDKPSLHLDLEQDVLIYSIDRDQCEYLVYLVQTKNERLFNKNAIQYISKNQMALAHGTNAVFVTQKNGKIQSRETLTNIAASLLESPTCHSDCMKDPDNQLLSLTINNLHHSSKFQQMKLRVSQKSQSIQVSGQVTYPHPIRKQLPYTLNPKGIFLYSRFIPKALPDTLLNFLPDGLPHFKNITAFAFDYQGMGLENPIDSLPYFYGHLLVPKMNLIIQTEQPAKVAELWAQFPKHVQGSNLSLHFGNTTYYLKQLDERTYFIGIDPSSVKPYHGSEVLVLTGDLRKSTKVYGSAFITALIENMGPTLTINQFFNTTDSFRIEIGGKGRGNVYDINGSVQFKNGHYPLHELTKLLVNSPFVQ